MVEITKHKIFISFHSGNDQDYKDELVRINGDYDLFIDKSVNTGDVSDDLTDDQIREKIRDDYLRSSTVTIVLVGTETKNRKHVDWEIAGSMRNGVVNKKSGILVVLLPTSGCSDCYVAHGEKDLMYPEISNWTTMTNRKSYEEKYPCMPARLTDNLEKQEAKISVMPWAKIEENPMLLKWLIHETYSNIGNNQFNQSRALRRANS